MIHYPTADDTLLMELIAKSDRLAFEEIYTRYKVVLFLHAKRMLSEEVEAKDVIQDIFVTLWQKRESLFLKTSLKAYLYATVKHKILNLFAHRKFEIGYFETLKNAAMPSNACTDFRARENALAKLIEMEIENLPPKMRTVFELSRKQHLSHKEIAEHLNISDKTVKKQINNALMILRPKINAFYMLL